MAIEQHIVLKHPTPLQFTPLQFMEDIGKAFVELIDLDDVEDLSHLRIAGDAIDAKEILERQVVLAFLKRQERRVEESLRENMARENMAKADIKESTIE